MHPGLPCYYRKKGDNSNKELVRGATVTMENGDLFSLHSNPDCEFAVIQNTSLAKNGTEESDDDEVSFQPRSWCHHHQLNLITFNPTALSPSPPLMLLLPVEAISSCCIGLVSSTFNLRSTISTSLLSLPPSFIQCPFWLRDCVLWDPRQSQYLFF